MEQINSNKCSNIKLDFEYLDHFLIQIRRIFTDPVSFSGEVYSNAPMYNGELFHLFSLGGHSAIELAVKDAFQQCDEFLIEYPTECHQVRYQVPVNEDHSLDDVPF